MARTSEAIVEPDVLVWARETARLTIPVAAKKMNVSEDRLSSWEAGEARPTVAQMRKASEVYKRPLAVFYLPQPPKTFDALRDFRTVGDAAVRGFSPELAFEIRRIQAAREDALELSGLLGDEVVDFPLSTKVEADVELIATQIRDHLGIDIGEQLEWRAPYKALRAWRDALEHSGVLVFQLSGVAREEVRGISVHASRLPAVAINSKDSPRARIFSLMHELAHILLHAGGACDLDARPKSVDQRDKIERFCNSFAAAVLLPRDNLLVEADVAGVGQRESWPDSAIQRLSKRFSVSDEVVLLRLLTLGKATADFYWRKFPEYRTRKWSPPSGPVPMHRRVLAKQGTRFPRLVLAAYNQRRINVNELSDYLEVKPRHIFDLEAELLARSATRRCEAESP